MAARTNIAASAKVSIKRTKTSMDSAARLRSLSANSKSDSSLNRLALELGLLLRELGRSALGTGESKSLGRDRACEIEAKMT
jgi:hypothetical protein